MDLKKIFDSVEGGALTLEQFNKAISDEGIKLADISTGEYVSRRKYDDELRSMNKQIDSLNETITGRDADLVALKEQLENAGTDKNSVATQLSDLQAKYDNDMKNYQAQLETQAYEFAVQEFANTKKFSSNGAKNDFIATLKSRGLQMEGNTILGAEDFAKSYAENDPNAFITEPSPEEKDDAGKRQFVNPTTPKTGDNPSEGNVFGFNFTGVRKHD